MDGGVKQKNNIAVCKAIQKIKNEKIKFIVIGSLSKDGEKIKEYPFVEYYEKLSHEEVLEKMSNSNLYIQNSYFETFGLAVVEAMSVGCKILVSKNVGALSVIDNINEDEIIKNNEDIEEIEEKIKKTINKKEKVNYITNYDEHNWNVSAKKLLDIMEKEYESKKGRIS